MPWLGIVSIDILIFFETRALLVGRGPPISDMRLQSLMGSERYRRLFLLIFAGSLSLSQLFSFWKFLWNDFLLTALPSAPHSVPFFREPEGYHRQSLSTSAFQATLLAAVAASPSPLSPSKMCITVIQKFYSCRCVVNRHLLCHEREYTRLFLSLPHLNMMWEALHFIILYQTSTHLSSVCQEEDKKPFVHQYRPACTSLWHSFFSNKNFCLSAFYFIPTAVYHD